jgi:hypothetical protein
MNNSHEYNYIYELFNGYIRKISFLYNIIIIISDTTFLYLFGIYNKCNKPLHSLIIINLFIYITSLILKIVEYKLNRQYIFYRFIDNLFLITWFILGFYAVLSENNCSKNDMYAYFYIFILLIFDYIKLINKFCIHLLFIFFTPCLLCIYNKKHKINDISYNLKTMNQYDNFCSICLDNFHNKILVKKLPCNHIFHSKCINKWFDINYICPNCRQVPNIV